MALLEHEHERARPDMRRLAVPATILLAVLVALAGALLPLRAAWAANGDWSVVALKEPVKVSSNGNWRQLRPGESVRHGAWVKTGSRGSVTLERDGVSVTVNSGTIIAVAGLKGQPDMTALVQRWGSTSLDVETRSKPRVKVHTPFMAAVVKGTRLDVNVSRTRTDIGVREGLVSVEDSVRGRATEVSTGQSAGAGMGSRGEMRVRGRGARAAVTATAPKAALVSPVNRRNVVTPETANESKRQNVRREMSNWNLRTDERTSRFETSTDDGQALVQRRALDNRASSDRGNRGGVGRGRGNGGDGGGNGGGNGNSSGGNGVGGGNGNGGDDDDNDDDGDEDDDDDDQGDDD